MFSLYLHIPFCVRKCLYCDFLSGVYSEEAKEAYVKAMLRELKQEADYYKNRTVDTVFFGGGTPTLLSKEQLTRLMDSLYRNYRLSKQAEISMEMNPGTADTEKLTCMYELGINRLSIGLQSTEDRLLRKLGRIHSYEQFEKIYKTARKIGFSNINIDVMSALPGQTTEAYERTLQTVLSLEPEHISAYSLIIEEGTYFAQHAGELELPQEEEERRMYYLTGEMLGRAGYERYEISNYAKKGYACRHNLAYWKRTDYAGFGIGAASLVDGVRWSNVRDFKQYLTGQHRKEQVEALSCEAAMEEFMFLGLRCMEGILPEQFFRQFGRKLETVYGSRIDVLKAQGLLQWCGNRLCLTARGIDVSNYVFEQFLL
ncbi:MAG: oxygen-independent coproporphyrinogen III oxidase [Clostridiales bacterium]|nr:oxygen-independent coproporphyrinogen III oxidase [Clostridiales bacterium]